MADLGQEEYKIKSADSANKWKFSSAAFAVLVLLLILLLVVLQSITIAHLNLLPVVCPNGEGVTTSTTAGTTSAEALTGGGDQCCESQDAVNTQLLSQMNEVVNISWNILSLNDEHFSNNNCSDQLS